MHSSTQKLDKLFVFGGTYGNLQATSAILKKAETLGFAASEILFTGDMVAYCAQPQETTDLIRNAGIHIIAGNCEQSLAEGALDCGCGFNEGSTCDMLSAQWYSFCSSNLTDETKSWMGTLPYSKKFEIGNSRLLATHATPRSINEFVFKSDIETGEYFIPSDDPYEGYIVGHSGIPFVVEQNKKLWVNSGAAGMPANDGTQHVWYVTIQTTPSGITIETHNLEYDASIAADIMASEGMKNGYHRCLLEGIWPSHDVLPTHEVSRSGIPIETESLTIQPISELI